MRRRAYNVRIQEMKIAGEEVKFDFRPDSNDFHAEFMGEEYVDANFRALVATVKKKGKEYKPTVSIPVTQVEHSRKGNTYTDLTVTGIHSGNRNIMAREDATGEIHQFGWYSFGDKDPERERDSWRDRDDSTPKIVRRLTPEERRELDELTKFAYDAENRRDAKQKEYRIRIGTEIKQARARERARVEEAVENDTLEGDPRIAGTDHRSRKRR